MSTNQNNKFVTFFILFIVFVLLVAAFFIVKSLLNPAKPASNPQAAILPLSSAVQLTVQADTSIPFDNVGQGIPYKYNIENVGATPIPGTISVTGADVTCPDVNTIGNLDGSLDPNETLTCTSNYPITQADLDAGSVTSVTTANVNGILSAAVTTTVQLVQNRLLTLTKTATPQSFDNVGQTITYTYVITNSGNVTLGPAQFTVSDNGLDAAPDCGDPNATLAPTQTVTCTATHTITQDDLNAGSVTNSATVSGSGIQASAPANVTVMKTGQAPAPVPTQINPSNLTQGTSIQHTVVNGEWLWQIARCFGADPHETVQANTQLADPDIISPGIIVTVPNVGSKGPIFGPPCTSAYTVQSGDTWDSIAQNFGASTVVLQRANPGELLAGRVLVIPLHSAS